MTLGLATGCTGHIEASGASRDPGEPSEGDDDGLDPGNPSNNPGQNNPSGYPAACEDQQIPARVWRLTPEQMRNTVKVAFGGAVLDLSEAPNDSIDGRTGFANGSDTTFIGDTFSQILFDQADAVARAFGAKLSQNAPCLATASAIGDACLRGFVESTGRRAFRRALSDEEIGRFVLLFRNATAKHGARGAAEMIVQALMLSPNFLYRTELGDAEGKLQGWEIASALAYGLTDFPPDESLLKLAETGALANAEERRRVATQMAATPAAAEKMAQFMFWQLKMHRLDNKAAELGEALVASMKEETRTFVREVMMGDAPTLETLYLGNFSYVDAQIAEIYGLPDNKSTEMQRTVLPAQERFGVATQPGWLAAVSGPIPRGLMIRESFLCQEVPLPPPNLAQLVNELPETPAEFTEAEKWDVFKSERVACAACHREFQPMGLSFERYDERGVFRMANEHGREIDPSGTLAGAEGWSGKFTDARDLMVQVVASPVGRDCFAQRYLTFVLGHAIESAAESCLSRQVGEDFGSDGSNLHALLGAVAAHDSMATRTP